MTWITRGEDSPTTANQDRARGGMTWPLRGAYGFLVGAALFASFSAGYRVRAEGEPLPAGKPALERTADSNLSPMVRDVTNWAKSRVAPKPDLKLYETVAEVRSAIKDNFVHRQINDTELTYGAVRGMLRSLDDRFTRFMTPEDYAKFQEGNEGEFTGIGARIDLKVEYAGSAQAKPYGASRPYIVEPIEGGPGQKAGLQKEDVILAIDGRSTAEMSEDATVAYIRGMRGTPVKLKIERRIAPANAPVQKPGAARDAQFKVFDVSINRDIIEIHPVTLEWMPGGIAWLRLDEFNKKSEKEMLSALKQVRKGNSGEGPARGLILDMRNNPGGLLDVAVEIGSHFISSGPIVYTRERNGSERSLNAENDLFLDLKVPVIVLINKYSASAAEVVTGALKDKKVATVVGENSYGKASVQVLVELKNGGALVITTAKYLTPGKHDITDKGISPDIAVKPSAGDEKDGRGAQLQKAVALIREKNGDKPAVETAVAARPGN